MCLRLLLFSWVVVVVVIFLLYSYWPPWSPQLILYTQYPISISAAVSLGRESIDSSMNIISIEVITTCGNIKICKGMESIYSPCIRYYKYQLKVGLNCLINKVRHEPTKSVERPLLVIKLLQYSSTIRIIGNNINIQ